MSVEFSGGGDILDEGLAGQCPPQGQRRTGHGGEIGLGKTEVLRVTRAGGGEITVSPAGGGVRLFMAFLQRCLSGNALSC